MDKKDYISFKHEKEYAYDNGGEIKIHVEVNYLFTKEEKEQKPEILKELYGGIDRLFAEFKYKYSRKLSIDELRDKKK
jgi:hypothetical protein